MRIPGKLKNFLKRPKRKQVKEMKMELESRLLEHVRESFSPGSHYKGVWMRDAMYMAKALIRGGYLEEAKNIIDETGKYQLSDSSVKVRRGRGLKEKASSPLDAEFAPKEFLSFNAGSFPTTAFQGGTLEFYGLNADIDSTALWIICACAYVEKSRDIEFGKLVENKIQDAIGYLQRRDADCDFLVEQGMNEDWEDCLMRRGKVSYSNALWFESVNRYASMEKTIGNLEKTTHIESLKTKIAGAINEKLWIGELGYYADYVDGDVSERLSLDTSLMPLFGIAGGEKSKSLLDNIECALWTDKGSLTLYPPYGKAVPDSLYQDSNVWPWICGLEASARAKAGDVAGAKEILERVYKYREYEWVSNKGKGARPFFTGMASLLEACYDIEESES
ncbi:MAG: hypothetical protein HZB68_05660 [Candidatus Aenigmarchaeota archaeon]|nr:hypothetical protein [Candidatus Aenigmarchaeota archaeon]